MGRYTPDRRNTKWDTKFNVERIALVLTDLRPEMFRNVQTTNALLYTMETEVKQVLDGEGVSIITYPFYLDFGREMWHLFQIGVSGESLAVEAASLIGKWVARGLTQSVLEKIRTDVFSIGAPAGP